MLLYYGKKASASLYSRARANAYLREHPMRTDFATPDYNALWHALNQRYPAIVGGEYVVDPARYSAWVRDAKYPLLSYIVNRNEKYLEHQVSVDLLQLPSHGFLIDVAAGQSLFAEIMRRRGHTVIAQDQAFDGGLHHDRLGGDACAMDLPDSCADGMTLHCSFDHFEGDADSRFLQEAARVLKRGRKAAILPLYLHEEYINLTDPLYSKTPVGFDAAAATVASFGFANRFGRHYSMDALWRRCIQTALACGLDPKVYRIQNGTKIDPAIYLNFAFVLTKQ